MHYLQALSHILQKIFYSYVPSGQDLTHFFGFWRGDVSSYRYPSAHLVHIYSKPPIHEVQALSHISQELCRWYDPIGQLLTHLFGFFRVELLSYLKPSAHSIQLWS